MAGTAQLALAGVVQGRPQRVPGRKRGAKPRPAASFAPLPCVVLGIDPGATSGWCILACGRYVASGYVEPLRRSADVRGVVARARYEADERGLPLVVVAETWGRGGHLHTRTLESLAATWGVWKAAAFELGDVSERRIIRVHTSTWTSKVIGGSGVKSGDVRRAQSVAIASRLAGRATQVDEAAGVCIALWGSRAGEVLERLPKRRGAA